MKKAIAYAASAAMALSMALTPAQAENRSEERKSTVGFCTFFFDGGKGPNQGRCIAFFSTDDPVSTCNELEAFGLLEEFGFRNRGECIVALSSGSD